jgi:hypothetical protein
MIVGWKGRGEWCVKPTPPRWKPSSLSVKDRWVGPRERVLNVLIVIPNFYAKTEYSYYLCPGIKFTHIPYRKWIQNNQCHIIIYLLPNNVLQKTKSNTLKDTVVERHHNCTSNRPGVIARLELLIEVLQFFFILWVVVGQGWLHLWLVLSKGGKITIITYN